MSTDPELTKAATLSASWYGDPSVHEREREAIFAKEWLVFCPGEQLRRPGDYVAAELAGWQVLVVVGNDGELRGFHNVCLHRAGPLVDDGCGHCPMLVCRYHGWAYELDGRLRNARDFGAAADFDPVDLQLLPVRAERWRSLVFVNLDGAAAPLVESLGEGFVAACAGFDLDGLVHHQRLTHDLECNWKTYADNYLEGYHIPFVHPGLNREVDARRYRVEVLDGFHRHSAPTRDGAVNAGAWLWRWPNLALNLYPGGMNVERYLPLGPHRTRLVYDYFFADPGDLANDDVIRISTEITEEDRAICEAVQRNLDAGAYTSGRLSPRHENGVFDFQQRVRAAVLSVGEGDCVP